MKSANAYIFGKTIKREKPWTAQEIKKIFSQARTACGDMENISSEYILRVLSDAGKLFADKKGKWRKQAFSHLSESISFSSETIEKTLDILPSLLSKEELLKRSGLELVMPGATDRCVQRFGYDGFVTAVPKGVVLHVGAGNVFLGVIDSLVLGILTKNINIVKTASGGSNFGVMFAQALKACDKEGLVANSVCILSWPGGSVEIEKAAVSGSDAVFVWGGAEAVSAYTKIAPSNVKVTGFGPKVSMAVVMESAVRVHGAKAIAEAVAKDVSIWDQSACASPHTVYIVSKKFCADKKAQHELARELELAFAAEQKSMPQGKLSADEKVEITKARQLAAVDQAMGNAFVKSSFPKPYWTVIFEKNSDFKVSPLNRVVYIKPVASMDEVKTAVHPYRGYVQSVGVAGLISERKRIARMLGGMGISRIARLGRMLESPAGSPHDGTFPMMQLVNFIGVEGGPSVTDKLYDIAEYARERSPFYREHFKNIGKIECVPDFRKLPLLDKSHILKNTPPDSYAMFTGPITGGVYFASGGSTGSPKYIFYDSKEYGNVCRALGFAMASAGLGAEDRAANLFVSGNMWSSWISVEKALSRTRAVSIPIGSALPMESILHYLNEFQVTAIIGLPSFLLKVAEEVKKQYPKYKIPLKYIFYGGEYVGPEMCEYFRSVFPGVAVHSAGYATVDAGVLGFQCPHCVNGEHHLLSAEQFLEVLDPETGNPLPKGEVGELVTTVLNKRHMPIIRFRLGDLGRWLDRKCPCGSTEPLFEILGRCDDRIHVGGAHVFVNDLQSAIKRLPELSFNFQVEILKDGARDSLVIKVEIKDGLSGVDFADAERRLMQAIRDNCEDLVYVLDRNWMPPPVLKILPPNTIERIARTGKIKKVVDSRVKI